jgi:hypothetical protein
MKTRDLAWLMALLMLVSPASAISIGTAPGVYDLGELDPGQNVAFRFYLITNAQNDMLVNLDYIPVHQDMFSRTEKERYMFVAAEASQEDVGSWVEIPRNPLLLSPAKSKVVYLAGGGVVKANEEADPGYHAGSISLNPQLAAKGTGTGVTTIAVTRFVFVFKVSGEAARRGEITTIIGDRVGEKEARIDVLFKNTGTCTLTARVSELKLYDKFGEQVADLKSGISVVRPNMIDSLSSFWTGENVKPGTYRAEAKVDYVTGSAYKDGTVEIPATIKVRPSGPGQPAEAMSLCGLLPQLLAIILILALVVYWLSFRQRDLAFLVLGALFAVVLTLYVLTCVLGLAFSWLDALFVIIILALIIYWRLS